MHDFRQSGIDSLVSLASRFANVRSVAKFVFAVRAHPRIFGIVRCKHADVVFGYKGTTVLAFRHSKCGLGRLPVKTYDRFSRRVELREFRRTAKGLDTVSAIHRLGCIAKERRESFASQVTRGRSHESVSTVQH